MIKLPVLFFFSTCLILPADSQCNDHRHRPICPVLPNGQDVCYYGGLISPPVNTTVYVGQTAVFYSETLQQCNIRAYINNCRVQDDRHHSDTINNITYSNCTLSNVQISDDGTRIDVYIFSNDHVNGGINCYSPVFLTVIGFPPSPHNLTKEIYCDRIVITGPWSENTTAIYIRIMQGNDVVFSKNESVFPVNISESVFKDHHKYYKIVVYNKNPTGLSQQYFEMDLHFKDIIHFDISSSSLEVVDNNVVLNITVQFNTSCPLSVPQQFILSSNCLINNFYQVINRTTINESGLIDLSVALQLNKLNCTITLSSGEHKLHVTNQNTYEVQEVIISEYTSTGYFNVNCTFLTGSQAKGCAIEIFKDTGDFLFNQNLSRLSSTSLFAVGNSSTCLNNGIYTIYVYIWDKYGRVNKSLEVAQRPLTVTIGCKEKDSFSKSITMATTPKPTISMSTALSTTPIWYYVVGIVGFILIVVLLLCCCCVLYYYMRKKNNLIVADNRAICNEVMYNVEEEMVTISQATKSSGIPIVSGITSSTHNTNDNSTAISAVTSDYSESATLLRDEPVTLKSHIPAKPNKTSDTNKQTFNDEKITERITSSLLDISEVEPILEANKAQFENNDAQIPSFSGKPTADDTEFNYQSIVVEEGSNNNQSSSEVVPIPVTSLSIKEDHTENVSENIFRSEMVAQQSQPHKPIEAKDTTGNSKLQVPPNPKWNPSSKMRQNNVVMTIPNKPTTINDHPDKTNQSVSDENDPSTI